MFLKIDRVLIKFRVCVCVCVCVCACVCFVDCSLHSATCLNLPEQFVTLAVGYVIYVTSYAVPYLLYIYKMQQMIVQYL